MHMSRELIHFGNRLVAFVMLVCGERTAVSYNVCYKLPTERTWRTLERQCSFDAEEAQ
jgi:hypothetical protein